MNPLTELDLENIEHAARIRNFAHPADTLRLVADIRRLQEYCRDHIGNLPPHDYPVIVEARSE